MDNITEKQNSKSENLNHLEIIEILEIINTEDQEVASKVHEILPRINFLILDVIEKMNKGGRIFYIGCGTSGACYPGERLFDQFVGLMFS